MNVERLYVRLRLTKAMVASKDSGTCNAGKHPWLIRRILQFVSQVESSQKNVGRVKTVLQQASRYLQEVERAPTGKHVESLKEAIHAVCRLFEGTDNLMNALSELCAPTEIINSLELHELGQIARYAGLCRSLSKLCRTYADLFSNVAIETATPYKGIPALFKTSRQPPRVHAEVQIVLHFDLRDEAQRPRVIGSTKAACFLCNSFVRAHGHHYLSSTHGYFYRRWTIPDLKLCHESSKSRFPIIFDILNADIMRAHIALRGEHHYSLKIVKSVLDVSRRLWSPVASSISSCPHETVSQAESVEVASQSSVVSPLTETGSLLNLDKSRRTCHNMSTSHLRGHGSKTEARGESRSTAFLPGTSNHYGQIRQASASAEALEALSWDVSAGKLTRIQYDKLELFVELDAPSRAGETKAATVSLYPKKDASSVNHLIDAAELPIQEPGLILTGERNLPGQILFAFRYGSCENVLMDCRWI